MSLKKVSGRLASRPEIRFDTNGDLLLFFCLDVTKQLTYMFRDSKRELDTKDAGVIGSVLDRMYDNYPVVEVAAIGTVIQQRRTRHPEFQVYTLRWRDPVTGDIHTVEGGPRPKGHFT